MTESNLHEKLDLMRGDYIITFTPSLITPGVFAEYLHRRWSFLLHFDPRRLTPEKLAYFARIIHRKGAPLNTCWGFVDGTFEFVARPVRNQRILYNGWKRGHGLKFQTVIGPDGIRAHVYGPIEGRRHDETLYKYSEFTRLLEEHSHAPDGTPLVIYGDPAYGLSKHLICPYKGLGLTASEKAFNGQMSKVREAVEWSFAEINNLFAFLTYGKNLKVLLQPVGVYSLVAFLLCNAHTILHGSQISTYFECPPPTLGEYFNGTAEDAHAFLSSIASSGEDISGGGEGSDVHATSLSHEMDTVEDLPPEDATEDTNAYMNIVL